MSTLNILWRNVKWRLRNPITIIMSILQPMIWLLLYSAVAGETMKNIAGGNYTAFILPGILVLVIFASSGNSGMLNYFMKARGSFYRIQISPIKRSSIVLGHVFEAILLSFLEVLILYVLSLFFSVHLASGVLGMLIILLFLLLTSFFMANLSYSLSLKLPNEEAFETVMTTIILPIFFLSPALFPVENLKGGLKIAVFINPFSHIIINLRNLILKDYIDWSSIIFTICLFLVLGILSFILAVYNLKKDGKE